jgi:hypothetical protein
MAQCELCGCDQQVSWDPLRVKRWFSAALFELEQAINKGCRACTLLRDGIQKLHHIVPTNGTFYKIDFSFYPDLEGEFVEGARICGQFWNGLWQTINFIPEGDIS